MPETATYKDGVKIEDMSYEMNGVMLSPVNSSYMDFGFLALYKARTENINHTAMIFADNTEIYNFMTVDNAGSEYMFTIEMDLDDYEYYYLDNVNFGNISYSNQSQSLNYSSDYIVLYTSTSSLIMFFEDDVMLNLTYYNTTLTAKISIPLSSSYEYRYVFHDANFSSVKRAGYVTRPGVMETIEGLYLGNISSNYTYLKEKWGFPSTISFSIEVYTNSSQYSLGGIPSYEIGSFDPKKRNVYAKKQNLFALDEDGSYLPLTINYRVW